MARAAGLTQHCVEFNIHALHHLGHGSDKVSIIMAVIVQRLFTGGFGATDNAIQLYNEELILPFYFGDNWTKLRVVVQMGLGNTGTVNALVDIGVCTAGNRGIGSGTPANYLGCGFGGNSTRAATPSIEYATDATGGWPSSGSISGNRSVHQLAQHGATVDYYFYSRSGGSFFGRIPNSTANGGVYYRGMLAFDVYRVSDVLFQARFYYPTSPVSGGAGIDVPAVSMMNMCESAWGTPPTVVGYNLQTSANVSVVYVNGADTGNKAYTGSAGPLNAVNISWTTAACDCTIWGIAVAKHL